MQYKCSYECITNSDCNINIQKPICSSINNRCISCLNNQQCLNKNINTPYCNYNTGACDGCITNLECQNNTQNKLCSFSGLSNASTCVSYVINSKILTQNLGDELFNVIGLSSSYLFKMLYQASRDGFGASNFHSHCNGILGTLVIVKDTNLNIFGGFTKGNFSYKTY